jgi:hypothetical protein
VRQQQPQRSAAIAEHLLTGFPAALREAGLAIDPGRSADFLRATKVCRLDSVEDLARIGRVTLTGSPEDFPAYDAVFGAWFGLAEGRISAPPSEDEEAAPPSNRPRRQDREVQLAEGDGAGRTAADDHLTGRRAFPVLGTADRATLERLRRGLAGLPAMASRRWAPAHRGPRIDVARTARAARRTFGETLRILESDRPPRPRRLLLLVDVSGSMKAHSEATLRFAHLITRSRPRVDSFCFGTRLSRVTAALKHRDGEEALARLAGTVFDFDGGTQIGASLEAFLSTSRHAALVRGAVTLIFSDGLERGDPARMTAAVERLARLSHRLVWVTPLAADPRYRPATRGMAAVLPSLDAIESGAGLEALARLPDRLAALEHLPRRQAARRFQGPSFEARNARG